jgi:hypothetical protein
MKIVNIVRAALFAAFAIGASALVPSAGGEAQAQSGWHGPRAQHHRAAPRPAYRHRGVAPRPVYRHRHVAPHRVHRRPVVRHYGPRFRPVYASPRRCVIRTRWVNTYYGPQLVRQRVCHPRW